jgi:hypothetical protein
LQKEFFIVKNTFKVLGIIVLVAVIGISMAACGDDGGDTGIGGFANTTWVIRTLFNPGSVNSEPSYEVNTLSFITSKDWALYSQLIGNPSSQKYQDYSGNYTVSGGTVILTGAGTFGQFYEHGRATISGNTLTMIGDLARYGSTWTRE